MDANGCTRRETNTSHLKMDVWKMNFLLKWPMFRGYVGFRECNSFGNMFYFMSCFFSKSLHTFA